MLGFAQLKDATKITKIAKNLQFIRILLLDTTQRVAQGWEGTSHPLQQDVKLCMFIIRLDSLAQSSSVQLKQVIVIIVEI